MIKAEEIFKISMSLSDNLSPDGSAEGSDNIDYRNRTPDILNALIAELRPYSKAALDGNPAPAGKILSLEDAPALEDSICLGVLPYGLAAALLIGEDPETAAFLQSRYLGLKAQLSHCSEREIEDSEDVYGGIGFSQFSRW